MSVAAMFPGGLLCNYLKIRKTTLNEEILPKPLLWTERMNVMNTENPEQFGHLTEISKLKQQIINLQ